MALVIYEPATYTPLTSPMRSFELPWSGIVTMQQHWQVDGIRTGGAVWDASQVLGHYLDQQHNRWFGHSSLELGAGLGYASIVASRCGFSEVLATDGDAIVVPFARENVRKNALAGADVETSVEHFEWGDATRLETLIPSGSRLPDLIMASDIIYIGSTGAWGSFLQTVAELCRRRRNETAIASKSVMSSHDGTQLTAGDPLVLLSHTRRHANEEAHFMKVAHRERFQMVALPESTLHATYRNGRSVLFELRWKGDADHVHSF